MSDVKQCDACKPVKAPPCEGWMHVRQIDGVERSLGEYFNKTVPTFVDWHVCSFACLGALALDQGDLFSEAQQEVES